MTEEPFEAVTIKRYTLMHIECRCYTSVQGRTAGSGNAGSKGGRVELVVGHVNQNPFNSCTAGGRDAKAAYDASGDRLVLLWRQVSTFWAEAPENTRKRTNQPSSSSAP